MSNTLDPKYYEHLDFVACGYDRFEGFDLGDRHEPSTVKSGGEWTADDEEWLCHKEKVMFGEVA